MAINKMQWVGIENALKFGAQVRFLYQGHEIDVLKIKTSETKMAYIVSEGDHALLGFLKKEDNSYNPLTEVFLRKRLINPHARLARSISKERGGKAYLKRKENRYMTEKTLEVTETFFSTARAVVTHFRKINGLELSSNSISTLTSVADYDNA